MAYEDQLDQLDPETGIPPVGSPLMNAWDQSPSAFAIMGANAYRGSNTILHGPSRGRRGKLRDRIGPDRMPKEGSITRRLLGKDPGTIRTMGPSHWATLGSYDAVGGWDIADADSKKYTPFGQLGKASNWGANKAIRAANKHHVQLAQKMSGADGSAEALAKTPWSRMMNSGMITEDMVQPGTKAPLLNGGFYSRLSASAKVAGPGTAGRKGASVGRMLAKTDKGLYNALGDVSYSGMSKNSISHIIGASQEGVLSRGAAGYMSGLRGGGMEASVRGALEGAGRGSFIKGFEAAGEHLALGGGKGLLSGGIAEAAAKGAAGKFIGASSLKAIGMAIPYVDVAMWAWTAYDFVKAGAAALKEVPGFMKDAAVSFKGDMGRPMFGSGFKDNTVAATSRQRGVMAIQNSRLNARSVLGSEAAPLHSHFG
jgi:hypothetical protein